MTIERIITTKIFIDNSKPFLFILKKRKKTYSNNLHFWYAEKIYFFRLFYEMIFSDKYPHKQKHDDTASNEDCKAKPKVSSHVYQLVKAKSHEYYSKPQKLIQN